MKFKFIGYDYDYFDFEGKNFVKIFGRTDDGKKVCLIDSYDPSFWVVLKKGKEKKAEEIAEEIEEIEVKRAGRNTKVLKTEIKDKKFLERKVRAIRVYVENYKDAHAVADEIGFDEVEKRREYDLKLVTKYIMDKDFLPMNWYEIEAEKTDGFDLKKMSVDCFELKNFKKTDGEDFKPNVMAFDIETNSFDIGKGEVLMISLYGENFKKVLTWKKCEKKQDFVECFKSEKEMIKKFVEYVGKQDLDFLMGYFSDGFDLPYLRENAKNKGVRLKLGVDGSQPKFSRGMMPSGRIHGLTHVDLFKFIRYVYSQYLQSETLSLNDVCAELLGNEKMDFDFSKLSKMKDDDWRDFFEYNLKDAKLTYDLFQKVWTDIYEFSRVIHEPVYEIIRNSMSSHVEDYVLHNLYKYNEIAEKRPLNEEIRERRKMGKYGGAFVFKPEPGLYEDIGMFDFTSMYGSVIVSYNLSKSTCLEKKEKDALEVDIGEGKAYFSKDRGFFPEMLGEIIDMRKKYKKQLRENPSPILKARSNAYKLLANAAYGYQGFFGARYYCREAAAATAALAKKNILEAIDNIKNEGYGIIYSDTDSIAFLMNGKNKKETLKFLKELNSNLPGIMELELEDFFKRGLFVLKRGGKGGAKKKYALMDYEDKLKIRGFETVRRDWCVLARNLQKEILEKILKNGNEKEALEILKKKVNEIKGRKIDRKDLIIRTQLKKPLSEYKSEGPHVYAAKKMEEQGIAVSAGDLIEFYISEEGGKKRIRDRAKLPDEEGEYDIEYYLENQILPVVENIFEVFDVKLKEVIEGHRQMGLGDF